jgi:hypothetical protein
MNSVTNWLNCVCYFRTTYTIIIAWEKLWLGIRKATKLFFYEYKFEKGRVPHFLDKYSLYILHNEYHVAIMPIKRSDCKYHIKINNCYSPMKVPIFLQLSGTKLVHFVALGISPHFRIKWIIFVTSDDNSCLPHLSLLSFYWLCGLDDKVHLYKWSESICKLYTETMFKYYDC